MAFKFRRALIEITNACNLSCGFCASSARPRGLMPLELFETAAAQVKEFAAVVSLHLLGEPFMHPQLPEILAASSRLGLNINLVTNGTLLEKYGRELFKEPCLGQVSVSLQSLAALPAPDRLRVLRRLAAFAGARPSGLITSFRLRCGRDDPFFREVYDFFRGAFPCAADWDRGALKLAEKVYLNTGELFRWRGGRPAGAKTCLGLRHHFGILYGGEVVPCCADYDGALAFGNIKDAPLREILSSPRAAALRAAIASGASMPAYCAGCGFLMPG
ncbi:MAG TPA: radical SAM/SPASM domain-containing protein [Elusimicrobiales bacterium]|nr:radical SAM/SPASM domain-containing protein [Elusimicrobiales bacterium]